MDTSKRNGELIMLVVPVSKAPSDSSFWQKISKGFKKMGGEVAILAIKLWLVMKDANTPWPVKIAIGSALAYLVMPIDAIPDVLVGVGYTDDLAALIAAGKFAGMAMTEEHDREARRRWNEL
jgi:uncharacterized membrane protein YkvA (DUF1232 family)